MTEGGGSTRFDRDTGQVYRERLVAPGSMRRRRAPAWHQEPAYTATRRRRPGRRGPASLLDMAVKLVADNIGCVGVDALRRCPAGLVWRVWDYLDHRRRGVSFHAWKTILLALPDRGHPRTGVAPPRLLNYHQVLPRPGAPLQVYLDPLAASPFEFLTGVIIASGAHFDESELLALPRLRNLAFLALVQPMLFSGGHFPRVTDRLIREWALLSDPFPALRSLVITNQGQTTAQSLVSVAQFPAIEMYAVGGRRADWAVDPHPAADCWHRQPWQVDMVAGAAEVVPLLPRPFANLELGSGSPYRDRYETQYAFHRVRPGDDPKTPQRRLGFHVHKRKRKAQEDEEKKGRDAPDAQPGPSQPSRGKRLKGLEGVFQSFGA